MTITRNERSTTACMDTDSLARTRFMKKSRKTFPSAVFLFTAPPHRVRLPAALPGLRRDTLRGTRFCKNSSAKWWPQGAVLTQWVQEEQVGDVRFARILCRRLLKPGVLLAGWKRAPLWESGRTDAHTVAICRSQSGLDSVPPSTVRRLRAWPLTLDFQSCGGPQHLGTP
jgi:hypothetical protein